MTKAPKSTIGGHSRYLLRPKPHRRDAAFLFFRKKALFTSALLALLCQALSPVLALPLRRHLIVEEKEDSLLFSSQSTGTGTSASRESRNLIKSTTTAVAPGSEAKEMSEKRLYVSSTTKTKSSNSITDDVRPTSRGHVQQLNYTSGNPWPGNNFSVYIGKPAWI
jgi:hypothetical protein